MRKLVSILQVLLISFWSALCVLMALINCLLFLSKRPAFFYSKCVWAPLAIKIMGGKLVVTGREKITPDKSYVVMANHCSYLDIAAMLIAFPIDMHFIAKKELKYMPFVGWYVTLAGMIFIDRKNTISAKESLAHAASLIRKGNHVALYPEGTASKSGEIGPLKKGGFHLAQDAEAYIVPVHILGTYKVWPSAAKLSGRGGTIEVRIGVPISPKEYMKFNMEDRVQMIRNRMIEL